MEEKHAFPCRMEMVVLVMGGLPRARDMPGMPGLTDGGSWTDGMGALETPGAEPPKRLPQI